jgi:hypothetical protein
MKILFDNVALAYETVTSDDGSPNYPAQNLVSPFLEKRFQSTALADRVVFDFDYATYTVDCFFYAFHTMSEVTIELYNGGALVYTQTINPAEANTGAVHFAPVVADEARVLIAGAGAPLYLGGVGFGEAYTMPHPLAEWPEDVADSSVLDSSPMGQDSQEYVDPLDVLTYSFSNVTRVVAEEIKDIFKAVGVGGHFWIDPTELNHAFQRPLYVTLLETVAPEKNGLTYSFTLKCREAR